MHIEDIMEGFIIGTMLVTIGVVAVLVLGVDGICDNDLELLIHRTTWRETGRTMGILLVGLVSGFLLFGPIMWELSQVADQVAGLSRVEMTVTR